jgi:hypothetical protein
MRASEISHCFLQTCTVKLLVLYIRNTIGDPSSYSLKNPKMVSTERSLDMSQSVKPGASVWPSNSTSVDLTMKKSNQASGSSLCFYAQCSNIRNNQTDITRSHPYMARLRKCDRCLQWNTSRPSRRMEFRNRR